MPTFLQSTKYSPDNFLISSSTQQNMVVCAPSYGVLPKSLNPFSAYKNNFWKSLKKQDCETKKSTKKKKIVLKK